MSHAPIRSKITAPVLLLALAVVIAFSSITIASGSTLVSSTTTSMDMFRYPRPTAPYADWSSPLGAWDSSFEFRIQDLSDAYDRAYIIANVPTVDIGALDTFNADLDALAVTLKAKIDVLEAQYQADGYWDANTMLEFNRAFYDYNYGKYNLTRNLINTYGLMGDTTGTIEAYYESTLRLWLYHGMWAYMAIVHNDDTFIISTGDRAQIEALYDAVYAQLAPLYASPAALEIAVAGVMEQALRDWIYTMDIDFFTAYQAQVLIYLQNAKDMGMIYDIDNDQIRFNDGTVTNSRALILEDLLMGGDINYGLFDDFFNANLDATGTGFIAPEDVFNSAFIQQIITDYVMYDFDNYDGSPGYFSKTNVLGYCYDAVQGQYGALAIPGSSYPPIPIQFAETLWDAADYYTLFGTLPELTSWIPTGAHTTVYDEYRHRNYLVVPFVDLIKTDVYQVTRTITYTFEDGTTAAPSVSQETTFSVTQLLLRGTTTIAPTSAVLPAVPNPSVTYPASNVTVLPPSPTVGNLTVNWNSANTTVNVVYPLEFSYQVHFVDTNGVEIKAPQTITGRWNTPYSVTAPSITGYTLQTTPANATGVFGTGENIITFVYKANDGGGNGGNGGNGGGGGGGGGGTPSAGDYLSLGGLVASLVCAQIAFIVRKRRMR